MKMTREYERLATVPLDDVLKAIETGTGLKFRNAFCHTTGNRLLTYFCYGVDCCVPGCSVVGEYFAIERARYQSAAKYHLNLYGRDAYGLEVMITSDHKLPRSRGGDDSILNRQPMCYPHNMKKGNQLIHL